MQPLVIGIIGAGANTRLRHIPGLRDRPEVRILGVANRTPESSRRAAAELAIPRAYDHWKQAIDDPDTNAIVIGTWPSLHAPATIAALEAGKHVLCEARMAMNLDEALRMRETARARPHLVAQLVPAPFSLRFDRTIQKLLADGYLGRVLSVQVRDGGKFLDPSAPLTWRQDIDQSGLNIMLMGIWYEQAMRWIGEATRVSAMARTFAPLRADAEGRLRAVHVPDHLDVIGELAIGAQLHMQFSAVTGLGPPGGAWIFGSEGTLALIDGKLMAGRKGDAQLKEMPVDPALAEEWRVEEEFVNAVRGLEPVRLTTFDTGVKYMAFTQAVNDSLRGGHVVPVPTK